MQITWDVSLLLKSKPVHISGIENLKQRNLMGFTSESNHQTDVLPIIFFSYMLVSPMINRRKLWQY